MSLKRFDLSKKTALIVCDFQKEFFLPTSGIENDPETITSSINDLIFEFNNLNLPVIYTIQAFSHPLRYQFNSGFFTNQGKKVDFKTYFHELLWVNKQSPIFYRFDPSNDEIYNVCQSLNFDNDYAISFIDYLKKQDIKHVILCGLTVDFTLKFTGLELTENGLDVTLDLRSSLFMYNDLQRKTFEDIKNSKIKLLKE